MRTDIDLRPPATVSDLMYVTGLGRESVKLAIREGWLPGQKLRGKYVVPAGEFDAYVAGTWKPQPRTTGVPVLIQRRKTA